MIGFNCPKDCPLCLFCSECHHLCRGKCRVLTIRRKQDALNAERSRMYPKAPVITQARQNLGFSKCLNRKCGGRFQKTHSGKLFCSTECNRAWSKVRADSATGRQEPPGTSYATP